MHLEEIGGTLVPIMIFAIPIIAIVGGITARIAQTMARTRIQELMIQERIKSIERGIAPPGPPPTLAPEFFDSEMGHGYSRHRAFGMRVGGAMLLAIAGSIMFALYMTGEREAYVWMTIPAAVGLVLLIASGFVPGRTSGKADVSAPGETPMPPRG